jgi:hypothetical protein
MRLTVYSCRWRLPELCCSLVSVADVPTATGRWRRSAVRRPSSRRPVMHVHDLMIFDYGHDYDGCRQHSFEESLPFRYLSSIFCPLCTYRTPLDRSGILDLPLDVASSRPNLDMPSTAFTEKHVLPCSVTLHGIRGCAHARTQPA